MSQQLTQRGPVSFFSCDNNATYTLSTFTNNNPCIRSTYREQELRTTTATGGLNRYLKSISI